MVLRAIARASETNGPTDRLFIGLHGWGANAQDLAGLANFLRLPGYQMMFPDAPFPHPYGPGGRMWYGLPDVCDFQFVQDLEPPADLQESRQQLQRWIAQVSQETGIPLERTLIAGFSQGGAMAMDVGLGLPLAGVLVLSGYLHCVPAPHPNVGPVLMVHGRQDPVVPLSRAHEARDTLIAQKVKLTYQEFDMGHEISPLVLQQLETFCSQFID